MQPSSLNRSYWSLTNIRPPNHNQVMKTSPSARDPSTTPTSSNLSSSPTPDPDTTTVPPDTASYTTFSDLTAILQQFTRTVESSIDAKINALPQNIKNEISNATCSYHNYTHIIIYTVI